MCVCSQYCLEENLLSLIEIQFLQVYRLEAALDEFLSQRRAFIIVNLFLHCNAISVPSCHALGSWPVQPCYMSIHFKEISIYVFPEKESCGRSPNFHIHVSVSELYIP